MEHKDGIRAVHFGEEHKGKLISMSKRKYTWEFEHGDHAHIFVLEMSLLSRKFAIFFDTKFIFKGTRSLFVPFEYETTIHDLNIYITEKALTFDLYIDHHLFNKENVMRTYTKKISKVTNTKPVDIQNNHEPAPGSPQKPQPTNQKAKAKAKSKLADTQDYLNADSHNNQAQEDLFEELHTLSYRRVTSFKNSTSFPDPDLAYITSRKISEPLVSNIAGQFHQMERLPKREGPQNLSSGQRIGIERQKADQPLVLRKINFGALSQYEIGNEKISEINFAFSSDQIGKLLTVVYQ
jgi:hypothetical protein